MRLTFLAFLILSLPGCKTRLLELGEEPAPADLSTPTLDFSVVPPDFAIPPDLTHLPDLVPPRDLLPPRYCDGIFVFDENNRLSFFDPNLFTFTDIATLACPAQSGSSPFSMAASPDGWPRSIRHGAESRHMGDGRFAPHRAAISSSTPERSPACSAARTGGSSMPAPPSAIGARRNQSTRNRVIFRAR